jgi:hypothetical protein
MRHIAPFLLLPVLTGCASQYCERGAQLYEGSVEQAPLQSPEGLQVPPPDPNFAIPEASGEDVKYATAGTDKSGRSRSNCLDAPPSLPAVTTQPVPEPSPEPPAEPPAGAEPGPAGGT